MLIDWIGGIRMNREELVNLIESLEDKLNTTEDALEQHNIKIQLEILKLKIPYIGGE